jgi:hypothetical protein
MCSYGLKFIFKLQGKNTILKVSANVNDELGVTLMLVYGT